MYTWRAYTGNEPTRHLVVVVVLAAAQMNKAQSDNVSWSEFIACTVGYSVWFQNDVELHHNFVLAGLELTGSSGRLADASPSDRRDFGQARLTKNPQGLTNGRLHPLPGDSRKWGCFHAATHGVVTPNVR
eukprot:110394-Amphidinium_carterae.1